MLPKLLTSRLKTILGSDYDTVMNVYGLERKWSFRLNMLKWDGTDVFTELKEKWIVIASFVGLEWVYFFDKKDDFALKGTDAFYGWKIYLQSIASLLPVLVLSPKQWETILDMCAAPGSKTTQIAMLMENEGKIVALEQNQIRYDKLMHNARLQWATIIAWEKIDARKYLETCESDFDRILLDAPCSAEGRIQLANEKTYGFWTLENIKKKSDTQYELLSLAIGKLKSGGTLVYSTCTLAPEENEWVLTRVLAENADISIETIDIGLSDRVWWKEGITAFGSQKYSDEVKKAVRILPSEETEGFFVAKIVKW